uniref:UDP-N-acetylglucosamine--N-acetylmuramyl-(pentapeptide) pyrophosphoryl-undecaprenol N-acetylglucosamine transferase n=1 Tax=Acetithermum autotrophicum TaxID=1446466 RepID=H5STJ2_ACEAU|nr:UDP-N-acetylglucosamine--N-acetylmuramyl-(pentapeptide) pyrophosphoryl-undecaprenol N-acetylglucosamine transferase [Candidatus Acetothermum autotrophicum]
MRILVCGGGTGGHLYPALALLEGLRRAEPHARLVYVGSRYGLETAVMPRYPWVESYTLLIRGIARPGQRPLWFLWALLSLFLIPIALAQALFLLLVVRPQLIIGVGGYGAFAPLLWGVLLRIPCYLHEQNIVPGMVTKIFAPWAKKVFLTYPQTARWLRARHVLVTGLPVRPEILSARPDHQRFGLQPGMKTVLVFGGSRGSQTLTETALAAQRALTDVQFLIVTGERLCRNPSVPADESAVSAEGSVLKHAEKPPSVGADPCVCPGRTVLVPYIHEMGTALATADVVICRAGAGTLFELAALRKPAIVVPWPGAAGDHQTTNARQLARLGLFSLVPEPELSPQRLAQEIKKYSALVRQSPNITAPQHKGTALDFILREVLLDATSTLNTVALYRNRRRRHEWVGQSLL